MHASANSLKTTASFRHSEPMLRPRLAAPWRLSRRLLCSLPKHQRDLSLVGAVAAADAAAASSRRQILRGVGAAAVGYFLYDAAIIAYARIRLGAAATEQLFMQGLDGEVCLELRLTAFSSQAELRGKLTPVGRRAPAGDFANHRDFSLLSYPPPKDDRTKSGLSHDFLKMPMDGIQRHVQGKKAREPPPPPVAATRPVSVFAPVHLSALFGATETRLYCRKTRYKTEYTMSPSALPAASVA